MSEHNDHSNQGQENLTSNASEGAEKAELPRDEEGYGPPISAPPFAILADGTMLLSAKYLSKKARKGRKKFKAIVLTPKEARAVLVRLEHAMYDAAGHIAGRLEYPVPNPKAGEE